MFNVVLLFLVLSIGVLPTFAQANFINTDWKVAGDSKAMLDQSTGLEWLRPTETQNISINQMLALIDQGVYQGWRLPTEAEVATLMLNFFGGDPYANRTVLSALAGSYRALFGQGSSRVFGLYITQSGSVNRTGLDNNLYYGLGTGPERTLDTQVSYFGVFLVSDGGTTISSILNPNLNINNPNAPVNSTQPVEPPPVADVNLPLGIAALLWMVGLLLRVSRGRHASA